MSVCVSLLCSDSYVYSSLSSQLCVCQFFVFVFLSVALTQRLTIQFS